MASFLAHQVRVIDWPKGVSFEWFSFLVRVFDRKVILKVALGALVVSWVTFAPCFLWIFLGAPYIERLRGNAVLARVLSCITAAVVGVILNLTVWFGVQVLFTELRHVPIHFSAGQTGTVALPVLERFDPLVGAMMVTALLAITVFRIGMIKVLLCSAAFGLAAGTAGLI